MGAVVKVAKACFFFFAKVQKLSQASHKVRQRVETVTHPAVQVEKDFRSETVDHYLVKLQTRGSEALFHVWIEVVFCIVSFNRGAISVQIRTTSHERSPNRPKYWASWLLDIRDSRYQSSWLGEEPHFLRGSILWFHYVSVFLRFQHGNGWKWW